MFTPSKNYSPFADSSLYFLIAVNLITAFFAIKDSWNIQPLLLTYWFQSVSIGLVHFFRILSVQNYTTGNIQHASSSAPTQEPGLKLFYAFFFLVHYGIFHQVYLTFILSGFFSNSMTFFDNSLMAELGSAALLGFLFFANHLYSYFANFKKDSTPVHLGKLMMYPYIRILPMHFTIMFAGFTLFTGNFFLPIIFFVISKTVADVVMHIRGRSLNSIVNYQQSQRDILEQISCRRDTGMDGPY